MLIRSIWRLPVRKTLIFFAVLSLVACGGGGDKKGSNSETPSSSSVVSVRASSKSSVKSKSFSTATVSSSANVFSSTPIISPKEFEALSSSSVAASVVSFSSVIALRSSSSVIALSSSSIVSSSFSLSSSSSLVSSSASAAKTIIYFKNTINYETPFIYYFNTMPTRANNVWPGVMMTSVNGVVSDGWYKFEFADPTLTSGGIVFNNGNDAQSADLAFAAPNNCYNGSVWQTAEACGVLTVSSSSSSSNGSSVSSSNSFASSVASSIISSDDFRKRTIYFMFVDRFANGNTTNDNGNNPSATSVVKDAGDQTQWRKYWGGDIAGVISKLDYLQALGISAIWVTPLVDNVDVGTEGFYHGYQAHDFYEVDEHLGDWVLVDELNAQMEARGMKLVMDIAPNHSNNAFSADKGLLLKERAFVTDFATGKGTWYHDRGTIGCPGNPCDWDIPDAFLNKMFSDLSDFNHGLITNSLADDYLIESAKKWMDHGVDAFRIDAIKHIEPSFINRFSAAMRAKKSDVYIFGEYWDSGVGKPESLTLLNQNRGSELLDFQFRHNIEKAIGGDITMNELSTHVGLRPAAMNNKEDLQPIFLDNHDMTRTSIYLQSNQKISQNRTGKGMAKAFADARQNMGEALVMTLPGVPVIYYGSEQNIGNFTATLGDGEHGADPFNRETMPSFSQVTPAFKMISALANLRKVSPAIQSGTYAERWTSSSGDLLVFQRQEGTDCAVVAVNRGAEITITVPNLCLANAAYTSKVGTDVVNIVAGSGTFNLSQNEVVVLH